MHIKKSKNVSIVIPIYNESKNISDLVEKIYHYTKNIKYEIIVVDDASTDNPEKILSKFLVNSNFIIYKNQKNLGQSKSIHNGIIKSKYETIITIDGDGQNNPKDIILLVEEYFKNQNLSLIGGIRTKRKDNLIKIISSRVANYTRMLILSDGCIDTGCSLKIFDRKIFLSFPFFDGMHRFLPALFVGFEKKTKFVNVDHLPRRFGVSKYGTLNRLVRGIRDIFKVAKIIKEYKRNRV